MTIRAVVLCCHLLLAVPLFARPAIDVLVMKNGDHLTCEIKGLSGGVLSVGLPYVIETLSVDWSKVDHLESKQEFIVKTEDGSVYRGVLNSTKTSADRPIEIQIAEAETPEKKVTLDSARIVDVTQTSEKFHQRFTGGLSVGSIYTKSNQTVQYSVSGLAAYPRERWALQAGISSNLSRASGTPTSTRNQLNFGGMHLLRWNNYFYGGFTSYLQSTEQGISGQNILGNGIGRYLKNTNRTIISVLGGIAWQNTRYNPIVVPIATQNVAAAMINGNIKLFKFNKTNLDLNALLLPALSEPGRVYFSTNASYYVKIIGNLSTDISFYGNWDNRPPGKLSGSDYGTTLGLSWTFGTSLQTKPNTLQ